MIAIGGQMRGFFIRILVSLVTAFGCEFLRECANRIYLWNGGILVKIGGFSLVLRKND